MTPAPDSPITDTTAELDRHHLDQACALAAEAARTDGGPFGAVVLCDGEVVATGVNRVTADHDPTAHAEVIALRAAGRTLGTNDLTGCVLYASCRPCPMCLAAAWWARVDRVVHAATDADAAAAGFDDAEFWGAMRATSPAPIPSEHVPTDSAQIPFEVWRSNPNRVEY